MCLNSRSADGKVCLVNSFSVHDISEVVWECISVCKNAGLGFASEFLDIAMIH